MLRKALMIASSVSAALPAPRALARGSILSSCNNKPWKGCPEGGSLGEKLKTGFSEAMIMYQDSSSKSDKSASASAPPGENGLDRATSKVFATSVPRTVNGTGHTGPSEFCATSI